MSSGALAIASIVTSVVAASATMSAGDAEKALYEQKAYDAKLQSKQQNIAARREGVAVMRKTNEIMARNVAVAFSGNIQPFMGGQTVDLLNRYTLKQGVTDYYQTKDNATLATQFGIQQANQYSMAGSLAQQTARASAFTQVAGGFMGAAQVGGAQSLFRTPAPTSSINLSNYGTFSGGI